MNQNHVLLCGRVGQIGKLVMFDNGGQKITVRLATTERFRRRDGEWAEQTEWHQLELRDQDADCIGRYLEVGQELSVTGKLRSQTYGGEGERRTYYFVDVSSFEFGRKPRARGLDEHEGAPARPAARDPRARAITRDSGYGALSMERHEEPAL